MSDLKMVEGSRSRELIQDYIKESDLKQSLESQKIQDQLLAVGISQRRLDISTSKTVTDNSPQSTVNLMNYNTWDGLNYPQYPGTHQYDPLNPQPYQQPYIQPFDYKKLIDQQSKIDQQQNYERLKAMLEGKKNSKSEFETIIDTLFTYQEKIDYLLTVGYIYRDSLVYKKTSGEDSNGVPYTVDVSDTIDIAFLREISIKFKNLLLTKPTLRVKI